MQLRVWLGAFVLVRLHPCCASVEPMCRHDGLAVQPQISLAAVLTWHRIMRTLPFSSWCNTCQECQHSGLQHRVHGAWVPVYFVAGMCRKTIAVWLALPASVQIQEAGLCGLPLNWQSCSQGRDSGPAARATALFAWGLLGSHLLAVFLVNVYSKFMPSNNARAQHADLHACQERISFDCLNAVCAPLT